jgi:putrescine transport system permease protein
MSSAHDRSQNGAQRNPGTDGGAGNATPDFASLHPGYEAADREPARSTIRQSSAARLAIVIPYLWLIALFLVPFLIVLKISLSQTAISQPPYEPVFDVAAGLEGVRDFLGGLSLANYFTLAGDDLYLFSYLKSLTVATVSTAILVLCGFPIAYAMARAPRRARPLLVTLIILPFWTSFLIRVYAWINILQHDGLLNQALLALGIVNEPVTWLATDTAVYIGLVYSYLPFMVLPLYASLEKLDPTLLEAAADLGCPRWKAFCLVTVPLALPGLGAGALLCFIPIVGEFVVPDLLGGSESTMIGQTLWTEFFANKDWPVASAVAVVLVILLVGPIVVYQHLQTRAIEER